jgi:hypothetical protein
VVLTVLIDLQTAFLAGALLTLFGKRRIETERWEGLGPFVRVGALFGLLYGLAVGFWCVRYPDWMWGYALEASRWPLLLWYPGFVVALAIAGGSGAAMVQAALARGRPGLALGVVLLALFLLGSVWAMTFEAYSGLSTYQAWHATPRGLVIPTNEDPSWVLGSIVVTILMIVFCVVTVVATLREGRRLPPL